MLASACSGGSSITPPPNTAPVANFTVPPCTINAACNFASTSTDDAEVTAWSWDFDGDGHPDATTANPTFTYTTDGAFNVSLTVHDAQGLSDTKTSPITIAPCPTGEHATDRRLHPQLHPGGLLLHQHQHRRGPGYHRDLCLDLRRRRHGRRAQSVA